METTIIYGAGSLGKTLFPKIKERFHGGKLFFADSNPNLWGTSILGTPIISPEEIQQLEYSRIIITTIAGFETIPARLTSIFKIPVEKIDLSFTQNIYDRTYLIRNRFLERFAEIVKIKKLKGNVVEGGVFEGNFAKKINAAFPTKSLYLFDTFEGFDERDIAVEKGDTHNRAKHFSAAISQEMLLSIMPYPERVVIRKGYFPETAEGIDDAFVFVNLDFDLFQPTLAGLKFFYPKMVQGGVILVHDYFQDSVIPDKSLSFQGVREAVEKYSMENNVMYIPIGDDMSIVLLRN